MAYKPIDSNETFQVDQDGKVIDSILRSVEPEVDENGPFIHYKSDKAYIADLVKKLHGAEAAKAYVKRFEASQPAEDVTVETVTEEPDEQEEPEQEEAPDKEYSVDEKVAFCKEYFEEHNDASYKQVEEALEEMGVNVNSTHIAKGKEAAGLK